MRNKGKITSDTEKAFEIAGHVPVVGDWVRYVPNVLKGKLAKWLGDDYMGSVTLYSSKEELERRLPKANTWFNVTPHFTKRGDNPPDYDLYLRVIRAL